VLIGYNLFCVLAVSGYHDGRHAIQGICRTRVVCGHLAGGRLGHLFRDLLRTLARRKEPHIYVANWYYMAFILVVAMLHIVNNLAVPLSARATKSYSLFSGVQDAMTQWWYGHNAVAFFLTAGFLGMMYYYLPKRAGRPIFPTGCPSSASGASPSSICGRARITCTTRAAALGADARHDLLGDAAGAVLGFRGNALLTLNGAWHKVRDDATLRFMMVAAVFYGLSTFEGSFMAIRP
jgi:cytochrome c oxidase cbb3-type subunit 1